MAIEILVSFLATPAHYRLYFLICHFENLTLNFQLFGSSLRTNLTSTSHLCLLWVGFLFVWLLEGLLLFSFGGFFTFKFSPALPRNCLLKKERLNESDCSEWSQW